MKLPPKKGKHSCARALMLRPASATTSHQARRGHQHLGQLVPRLHVCVTRRTLAAGFHIPDQRHMPEGRRRSKAQILRNKRSRRTARGQQPSRAQRVLPGVPIQPRCPGSAPKPNGHRFYLRPEARRKRQQRRPWHREFGVLVPAMPRLRAPFLPPPLTSQRTHSACARAPGAGPFPAEGAWPAVGQ